MIYDRKHKETGLCYLAGLEARKKEHRNLLYAYPDCEFYRHPLDQKGYYGILSSVSFEHEAQRVTHRLLIVLSQPMQHALRCTRARQLRELRLELAQVASRIGKLRCRTAAQVQARANACLRRSPVGHLMRAWAVAQGDGSLPAVSGQPATAPTSRVTWGSRAGDVRPKGAQKRQQGA